MNTTQISLITSLTLTAAISMSGCNRDAETQAEADQHDHATASGSNDSPAPTNRVEIPASVRQNLGITFAKVELRNIAQTLRVPGQFELLPTARREYRTPLSGRVELLVTESLRVEIGTPLYRVDASEWRGLHEQIIGMQAKVDSMGPLREAHRRHGRSLEDKVTIWEDRLKHLHDLRSAGAGSTLQFTEARSALSATQAELADVTEKDAELQAQQRLAEAELRSLKSRRELLLRSSNCAGAEGDSRPGLELGVDDVEAAGEFTVCAMAPGIVESLGITPGGLAEANGLILTVVQPEKIRFRARGLQADLGRLRDGLASRIAPPQGGSVPLQDAMSGQLQIGLTADADERTIDLLVQPQTISVWARAGVSAHLEVTLDGGVEELAVPLSAVMRDGATPIIFRRDPANPDLAIRMEADVGLDDGRWIAIASGVGEGDEVVIGGNYQLMLATSGSSAKGGHFHPDGTFHEGKD
ncbi:MAG: hypothetical protein EXS00_07795 [Phycisphaerales bacterium]|nr:hypothetical protein [Phycisphaerales bacterium]